VDGILIEKLNLHKISFCINISHEKKHTHILTYPEPTYALKSNANCSLIRVDKMRPQGSVAVSITGG
jgi:hypothetical protein